MPKSKASRPMTKSKGAGRKGSSNPPRKSKPKAVTAKAAPARSGSGKTNPTRSAASSKVAKSGPPPKAKPSLAAASTLPAKSLPSKPPTAGKSGGVGKTKLAAANPDAKTTASPASKPTAGQAANTLRAMKLKSGATGPRTLAPLSAGGPAAMSKKPTPAQLAARAAALRALRAAAPPLRARTGVESSPPQKHATAKSAPVMTKKTSFKKAELQRFENLLLEKRDALAGDVRSMESQAFRQSGTESAPNHMADYGSDTFEQDMTLGLIETDEKVIAQINEALIRIQKNTYGVCESCGIDVPVARLEVLPWTAFCVQCQAQNERS